MVRPNGAGEGRKPDRENATSPAGSERPSAGFGLGSGRGASDGLVSQTQPPAGEFAQAGASRSGAGRRTTVEGVGRVANGWAGAGSGVLKQPQDLAETQPAPFAMSQADAAPDETRPPRIATKAITGGLRLRRGKGMIDPTRGRGSEVTS